MRPPRGSAFVRPGVVPMATSWRLTSWEVIVTAAGESSSFERQAQHRQMSVLQADEPLRDDPHPPAARVCQVSSERSTPVRKSISRRKSVTCDRSG